MPSFIAVHATTIVDVFAWIGIVGGSAIAGAALMFLFLRNAMPRMWF